MHKVLVILIAIKQFIKQYHWQASSYQEHILADKLEEDLEDYIDEVAELSVLAENDDRKLEAKLLLGEATNFLNGKGNATLLNIANAFSELAEELHQLSAKTEYIGLNDLYGRLSNLILRKIYLIQLQK